MNQDVLECLICSGKFSIRDAEKGRYFLETRICRGCYQSGQRQPAKVWCFGKKQTSSEPGFSLEHVECQKICPDRNICPTFIKERK